MATRRKKKKKKVYLRKWPHPWPEGLRPAPPSYHRLVAGQAVLAPLLDVRSVSLPADIEIVRLLHILWSQRVAALHETGLKCAQHPVDRAYLLNCPSLAFAENRNGKHPCNHYRICPFCWALQAEITFENITRALKDCIRPVSLWLASWSRWADAEQLPHQADQLTQYLTESSRHHLGSSWNLSLAPDRRFRDRFRLRWAHLVAVPAGTEPQAPTMDRFQWRRVAEDGRAAAGGLQLAHAIAKVYRFQPESLLGPARDIVFLQDKVMPGRKLRKTVGVFRSYIPCSSACQFEEPRSAHARASWLAPDRLTFTERLTCYLDPESFNHDRHLSQAFAQHLGMGNVRRTLSKLSARDAPLVYVGAYGTPDEPMPIKLTPTLRAKAHFHCKNLRGAVFLWRGVGYFALVPPELLEMPTLPESASRSPTLVAARDLADVLARIRSARLCPAMEIEA